ncbi:ATP-binding protein [Streptomyces sp. NPDC048527]|uniref:ATP-binding protein n=1 Tax=Streptomyces sp. NPDC048527 TaxID=3365568 RepID=UPI0037237D67
MTDDEQEPPVNSSTAKSTATAVLSAPEDSVPPPPLSFPVAHSSPVGIAIDRDPSRVKVVRRIVIAWMRNVCRMDEGRVQSAALVVSELLSNAVEHGTGESITVSIRVETFTDHIQIEVDDHTPSPIPEVQHAGPDDECGRGLFLIDSLTTELGGRWGFRPDGAVAWCLIPLRDSPDSVVS